MEDRQCTILYVDDEEKSVKYFARAFSDEFRILTAANASEGYSLLERHRDEIALLITDQRMAGEKGIDFLQRARRLRPEAVRILTTAYSDFDVAIEAVNSASIFKYVTKPWDIAELQAILKGACEFFKKERERDRLVKSTLSSERALTVHLDHEPNALKTLDQVAQYLNINKFTLYRLVIQKKIPAFRVGSQWRFKQETVDAWLMTTSNVRNKQI